MVYFPLHKLNSKLLLYSLNQLKTHYLAESFKIRKVLVAPLDWGLGHATRCIPLIQSLLDNGYEVLVAAEGAQQALLQQEFPAVHFVPLQGYRVQYSRSGWMFPFTLLAQMPRLIRVVWQEHHWLQPVIEQYGIDLVISDNRYGLYTRKTPCIFITHQLAISASFKWLAYLIQRINYQYINRFTACWVPDVAGENNLAGALSHPPKMPKIQVRYIGLLARFHQQDVGRRYDCCIVLSGPEPQRTILEQQLLKGITKLNGPVLLIRGKPGNEEELPVPEHVIVKNHISTQELQVAFLQSEYIICRSGYTTVMELLSLQKKSILIPTPGQTEQEYLAARLQQQHWCMAVQQAAFDLPEQLARASTFAYQMPHIQVFDQNNITNLLLASL